ncbi:nucleotidyltransferase-like protein [Bacillus sp. B15-48]|uniref:nucleotidyltransferase-like protein n=1 Tax=Bacillus sp. B15-48 TaxID=1548601 RepID=UPI00193EC71B|nr:nucleotidyltransferase-like protein [Bacillus sp. B15-48]MBM4765093.1 hypothetical protein [Bacillus sp. B15-48]
MEDILRPIYQDRASQFNTIGIMIIEKGPKLFPTTDTFDSILLVIVKDAEQSVFVKHYTINNKKIAMHIVTGAQIREWMLLGNNKKIFDWLYEGKIIFDRNEYIVNLKQELKDFPFYGRKVKIGIEFSKLIRRYTDGRAFFDEAHYLDAYNHVIHSLHHLARLAIIENGFHPEVTVWPQVKQIDPGIYKLYEELVSSEESLKKRLELLFLAAEFLIHSRTDIGASHFLSVLEEKEIWTFNDMIQHPEVRIYNVDLSIFLEYLIDKNMVEPVLFKAKRKGIYHRYYKKGKILS